MHVLSGTSNRTSDGDAGDVCGSPCALAWLLVMFVDRISVLGSRFLWSAKGKGIVSIRLKSPTLKSSKLVQTGRF